MMQNENNVFKTFCDFDLVVRSGDADAFCDTQEREPAGKDWFKDCFRKCNN